MILQRRESGATLAWLPVIVFVPFLGMLAFWFFGAKKLHLQRLTRRKIEKQLANELHKLQKLSATNRLPLDPPTLTVLQTAALSGVDVRLLLPSRSYYTELLDAGVKTFEVQDAMPHAKIVTIDSVISTLGSANMDQHGFRLSFEANAFLFSVETVSEMERNFLDLYRRQKK